MQVKLGNAFPWWLSILSLSFKYDRDASISRNNSSVFLGQTEMSLFCEQSTVITWVLKARTFVLSELSLVEAGRQSPRHKFLRNTRCRIGTALRDC